MRRAKQLVGRVQRAALAWAKQLVGHAERARWPLFTAGMTVLLGGVLLACVLVFPRFLVDQGLRGGLQLLPVERVKAENDARTTLLQGVAGLVLLAGAIAAWRQLQISREQLQHNLAASRQQLQLSREGQITERFTRAIDQLDYAKSLEVRLGAIYALERIALDSERYHHWPIMEVLTAYVRQHAPWPPRRDEQPGGATQPGPRPAPDIQAILTVIGRRERTFRMGEDRSLDLKAADLRGANLAGAHLEGAHLILTHLESAALTGAHLEGANLHRAHLEGANLFDAHLEGADLSDAHLEGADLHGAHLEGANLFDAHLEGAHLSGAHLEGAHLSGAHLERADLSGAHLEGAYLSGAHLEGAHLSGAHLERANLFDAHLEGANLFDAHLEGAHLIRTHLEGANLFDAHLESAALTGAHLEGAHLGDAIGLTQQQIDLAITDENTKLPDYLAPPRARRA